MFDFLKNRGWAGTLGISLIGAVWVVTTYLHDARVEFQKGWVAQDVGFCVEVSKTVGSLTASPDQNTWNKTIGDFWQFYWGNLVLIETPEIENAMVQFGHKLKITTFEQRTTLGDEAYAVSKSCRLHIQSLMQDGWVISPLKDLKIQ